MTHSLSSTMLYIQNIKFTICHNTYDGFSSPGTLASEGAYLGMRTSESSSKNALVEYRGWFYYDMTDLGSVIPYTDTRVLKIEVGDDTWTLSSATTSELE